MQKKTMRHDSAETLVHKAPARLAKCAQSQRTSGELAPPDHQNQCNLSAAVRTADGNVDLRLLGNFGRRL